MIHKDDKHQNSHHSYKKSDEAFGNVSGENAGFRKNHTLFYSNKYQHKRGVFSKKNVMKKRKSKIHGEIGKYYTMKE